jgi:hypothetical protein
MLVLSYQAPGHIDIGLLSPASAAFFEKIAA